MNSTTINTDNIRTEILVNSLFITAIALLNLSKIKQVIKNKEKTKHILGIIYLIKYNKNFIFTVQILLHKQYHKYHVRCPEIIF